MNTFKSYHQTLYRILDPKKRTIDYSATSLKVEHTAKK